MRGLIVYHADPWINGIHKMDISDLADEINIDTVDVPCFATIDEMQKTDLLKFMNNQNLNIKGAKKISVEKFRNLIFRILRITFTQKD